MRSHPRNQRSTTSRIAEACSPSDPPGSTHTGREIDPHQQVVRLVGHGKRVLELGCGAGSVSSRLHEQRCSVTGVEVDPAAAGHAAPHCERLIVGDLDTLDLRRELAHERFDVVLIAGALGRLEHPVAVLRAVRTLLLPAGRLVVRVHFSTREGLETLLEASGYSLEALERDGASLEASEFSRFIVTACPHEYAQDAGHQHVRRLSRALNAAQRQARKLTREVSALRHAAAARSAEVDLLHTQVDALTEARGVQRAVIADLHLQMLRRDEEIEVRWVRETELASRLAIALEQSEHLRETVGERVSAANEAERYIHSLKAMVQRKSDDLQAAERSAQNQMQMVESAQRTAQEAERYALSLEAGLAERTRALDAADRTARGAERNAYTLELALQERSRGLEAAERTIRELETALRERSPVEQPPRPMLVRVCRGVGRSVLRMLSSIYAS